MKVKSLMKMRNFSKILAFFITAQLSLAHAIYYGKVAENNQFPYVVLIHSPMSFCTGALISGRHVLTAAHCLMSIWIGGKVTVYVGANRYLGYKSTDGQTMHSDKFWIHEHFRMPSAVFDIGIIELPEPLIWSEKIQWLKLSTKINADLDDEDKEVYLAGWGNSEYSHGITDKIRYTKMDLIPINECMIYKSNYVEDMNENHICTRKIYGMPCDGDSGSVIVSSKTNKIIGVVSFIKDAQNGVYLRRNDCRSNIPAISTRISSYIDWISSKTGIIFFNWN